VCAHVLAHSYASTCPACPSLSSPSCYLSIPRHPNVELKNCFTIVNSRQANVKPIAHVLPFSRALLLLLKRGGGIVAWCRCKLGRGENKKQIDEITGYGARNPEVSMARNFGSVEQLERFTCETPFHFHPFLAPSIKCWKRFAFEAFGTYSTNSSLKRFLLLNAPLVMSFFLRKLSDECLNCSVLRIFQGTCQIKVFHVLNLANNQIQAYWNSYQRFHVN
jgi:hypothetical protein